MIIGPELTRRHPNKPLKSAGEIALIVVAYLKANLRTILVRRKQQLFRSLYPNTREVIYNRDAHLLFEYMGQPGDAQV